MQSGSIENNYRFTGKAWDAAAGLFYFNARWYDPDTGQFISEDPMWGNILDPQSLNRFAYGRNNPFRYVDPTGKNIEGSDDDYYGDVYDTSWQNASGDETVSDDNNAPSPPFEPVVAINEHKKASFFVKLYAPISGGLVVLGERGFMEFTNDELGICWELEYTTKGFGAVGQVGNQVEGGIAKGSTNPLDWNGKSMGVTGSVNIGSVVAASVNGQVTTDFSGNTVATFGGGVSAGLPASGALIVTEMNYIGNCPEY